MAVSTKRLTISVPARLVEVADEIAKETKSSRSRVIASCLEDMAGKRQQQLLAEGYKAMAKEHREFADTTAEALAETASSWMD